MEFVALNTFLYRLILTVGFIEYDYIFILSDFFTVCLLALKKLCVPQILCQNLVNRVSFGLRL